MIQIWNSLNIRTVANFFKNPWSSSEDDATEMIASSSDDDRAFFQKIGHCVKQLR